jgi:2,4-dienoyl-CoA reductase-like NADH-dependent reductase (Old Yellow Enzyme family)
VIILQICQRGSIVNIAGPELEKTILRFGTAAYKLRVVSPDGVQIHTAYGFLYSC